jgi:hypothetical protein
MIADRDQLFQNIDTGQTVRFHLFSDAVSLFVGRRFIPVFNKKRNQVAGIGVHTPDIGVLEG